MSEIAIMGQIPSLVVGASCVAQRLSRFVFVLILGFSGEASATLIDRGDGLIYDNITWVQDANLCLTLNDCVNGDPLGNMTWNDVNSWAATLVYRGFCGWRLPYASVSAEAGPTTTAVDCSTATQCRGALREDRCGIALHSICEQHG